jgi:hypothetical protein
MPSLSRAAVVCLFAALACAGGVSPGGLAPGSSGGVSADGGTASTTWPDYFMFGDPHTNYYMGEVYYDDVHLEVWR